MNWGLVRLVCHGEGAERLRALLAQFLARGRKGGILTTMTKATQYGGATISCALTLLKPMVFTMIGVKVAIVYVEMT